MMHEFYILACTEPECGGGIYRYSFDGEALTSLGQYACDRPMFSIERDGVIHTIIRDAGEGRGAYFSIDRELGNPLSLVDTLGVCPCHLEVTDGDVYVVNYLSGNIVKNGKEVVTRVGRGPHPTRQDAAHTHFITKTPDGYLAVADLGCDTLAIYDRELSLVSETKCPDGYGIRHLVFSHDGRYIYAVNELISSVSVYSYELGRASLISTTLIDIKNEGATAAAIKLSRDGSRLYVSVRGEELLCVFDVDGERVTLRQRLGCGGCHPRDIELLGDEFLAVCNDRSCEVAIFAITGGLVSDEPIKRLPIPHPLCCLSV